ncbi:HdeD family acid-resistance protein [Okibacterium endophyticum]
MSQSLPQIFGVDSSRLSRAQLTGIRVAFAVSGVVAIIVGVVIVAQPGAALTVVAWLFALFFLVAGVLHIVRAVTTTSGSAGFRWLTGILGVLLIVSAIVVLLNPGFGIEVLAILIGISWIVEGAVVLAASVPDSSKWLGVLYGLLSVVAGIMVILLPFQSAAVLLLIVAIMLIVAGVVQIVQAFTFGRSRRNAAS